MLAGGDTTDSVAQGLEGVQEGISGTTGCRPA
jgi:hypothetical protein